MRTTAILFSLCSLGLAVPLAAQDPAAAPVTPEAAVAHYTAVERELREAPPPADPGLAAARSRAIDLLHAYRTRGEFGRNPAWAGERVPFFVDAEGRRCAVAFLLDHTGNGALTEAIAGRKNHAWIADLAADPRLGAWLAANGLTVAEAARIQYPSPRGGPLELPPPAPPDWKPDDGIRQPAPSASAPGGRGESARGGAATPAGVAAGRTSAVRGLPFDAFESSTWREWWEWNGGAFQAPAPRAERDDAYGDLRSRAQRTFARRLLRELVVDADERVRMAAVLALGRMGALTEADAGFEDPSRSVHHATVLGLGSGGTAAGARALLASLPAIDGPELRATALTALALQAEGPLAGFAGAVAVGGLAKDGDAMGASAAVLVAAEKPTAGLRDRAIAVLRSQAPSHLRAMAAETLGPGADLDAVAVLTGALGGRSVDVRRSAALALGRSHHDLALPALLSAHELEHETLTRAMLLLAIGDHGGAAAQPYLLGELENGPKPARAFAALGLGLWGRGRPDCSFESRVVAAFDAERNQDQRGAYLLALGMLKAKTGVDVLVREVRGGGSSLTRGAAAAALGMYRDPAALDALTAAARGDACPWVRSQAILALGCVGSAAAPARPRGSAACSARARRGCRNCGSSTTTRCGPACSAGRCARSCERARPRPHRLFSSRAQGVVRL